MSAKAIARICGAKVVKYFELCKKRYFFVVFNAGLCWFMFNHSFNQVSVNRQ